uniref:Uncharacterized protein n=1 Tax=Panagrolaimus sp. JU765 TaxID=591449 RepID=A0AC34R4M9_9BILA
MQRGVEEVKKVGEATVGIHVQTRLDQRRLAELEAKATDIANLDNKITKKIQEELQMADDIKKANRRAGNYGVCELTTGYRQLMRHLATALETLDQLKAKSNKNSTPISTLTVDELDQLLATLRKISGMIKIEISGAEHC